MTDIAILRRARVIHEAKIALCWGPKFVGVRDPWPDFEDLKVLRGYEHAPISYVDIAVAQIRALDKETTK